MFVRKAEELASLRGRRQAHDTLRGVYKEARLGATGAALQVQPNPHLLPVPLLPADSAPALLPSHGHHVAANFFLHLRGWLYPRGLPPGWGRGLWWGEPLWWRRKPQYLGLFCQVCLLGIRRGIREWHELWLWWRGW